MYVIIKSMITSLASNSLPNSKVSKLKEHLEGLFPGQWINGNQRTKTLSTGLSFIDQGISKGLARQRISAWVGPASSGKTSLLRSVISRWLNCGFEIAYIDTADKLLASNWICLENSIDQNHNTNTNNQPLGKFWVVRNLAKQDPLWATETLIRSRIFDVIILDVDSDNQNKQFDNQVNWRSNKTYSRLQNALSKSNTALLFLTDNHHLPKNWNFYARLDFQWGANIQPTEGLNGKTMLLPTINCSITKNGLSHNAEIPITAHTANHLFTHSPIADRRSAKI
jgi:hypothetical protein